MIPGEQVFTINSPVIRGSWLQKIAFKILDGAMITGYNTVHENGEESKGERVMLRFSKPSVVYVTEKELVDKNGRTIYYNGEKL
jgi:hypothetical protein